ncbi:hypothetical protein NDU88_003974 [Pleurodeles waltl]|uniref:Uncharacterized protein n=1 Tax=Pleurodeles waltl TaxID=8319 RepID=A0AAV7LGS7_PLEWA|nr:hypothetical protein NDU88_003974 [Pleurodeles waltl]
MVLDEPFTVEELIQVISAMLVNKAPGLDGLTAKFYKEFALTVALRLLALYEESLAARVHTPSLREELIVTILKPDKDPQRLESYRPLSTINMDNKILAKLMA